MRDRAVHIIAMTIALLSAARASAGSPAAPPLANPPAEAIHAATLDVGVRSTLAKTTETFLATLKDTENNPTGLLFPPVLHRQILERKEVEVRYRKVIVKEPVYEVRAVEVEVLVPVQEGTQITVKKVKSLVKRRVKVGERDVERLVPDPEGDIVRTERHAVWGPGGPDQFRSGQFGNNALGLYLLLRCGVAPDEEPALGRFADALREYLDTFGIPDTTWDVALLAAAYASYPGTRHDDLVQRLVTKLLMGQITDGPARGLWGPVCINLPLLARMLEMDQQLAADIQKVETLLAANADNPALRRALDELRTRREAFTAQIADISQQGLRFLDVTAALRIEDTFLTFGRDIIIPGLPMTIYGETTADLESTRVALWGLRIAHEYGKLPAEVIPPAKDPAGKPIVRPEPTTAVLARTTAALAAAQKTDGSWDELNIWQEVHHFDRLGMTYPGYVIKLPERLPSPVTLTSTAQGYAALCDIAEIVGRDAVMRRYRQTVEKGCAALLAAAEQYLALDLNWWKTVPPSEAHDPPIGGIAIPYDLAAVLTAARRQHGSAVEAEHDLGKRLAWRLVQMQDAAGWWLPRRHGRTRVHQMSTSVYARMAERIRSGRLFIGFQFSQKIEPDADLQEVMDSVYERRGYWGVNQSDLATLCSMFYLAETVRPPVAEIWPRLDPTAEPRVAGAASRRMLQETTIRATFAPIEPGTKSDRVAQPGVLLIPSDRTVASLSPEAADDLRRRLAEGGLVLILADTSAVAKQFVTDVRTQLFAAMGFPPAVVAPEDPLFVAALGKPAPGPVEANLQDGRPAVLYLVVAPSDKPQPGVLSADQAGRIVAHLIEEHGDPSVLDPGYAIRLDTEGTVTEVFDQAVEALQALIEVTLRQKEEAAPPTAEKPAPTTAPGAAEQPPAPAPDEMF